MGPDMIGSPAETTQEINRALVIIALNDRLKVLEGDLKSAETRVKLQNDKILKLEAENTRLKMERTDRELTTQVEGLKIEVGKKDRELVDLRRRIGTFEENEAIILRRAAVAEQKTAVMQATIETMQKGRDAACERAEQHDQDRLDAVRKMIDAQDRAKKAEARVAELEKRGKPIAKQDGALKAKK